MGFFNVVMLNIVGGIRRIVKVKFKFGVMKIIV